MHNANNADDSHIIFCSFSEVTLAPTFARSKTWKRLTDVLSIHGEPKKQKSGKPGFEILGNMSRENSPEPQPFQVLYWLRLH